MYKSFFEKACLLICYILLSSGPIFAGERTAKLVIGDFSSGSLEGWASKEFKGTDKLSVDSTGWRQRVDGGKCRQCIGIVQGTAY